MPGHADAIWKLVVDKVGDESRVLRASYDSLPESLAPFATGQVIVDVTGLVKTALFQSILNALQTRGEVIVCHSSAEEHYPLNEEIEPFLDAEMNGEPYSVLEAAGTIWSGEQRPYQFEKLLTSDSDESRRRLLSAAASPKHERLLSLLDERSFDHVDVITPQASSPRNRLANLAADVATRGLESSKVVSIDTDDLKGQLDFIVERFAGFYVNAGFDVELAMTGSKMHAVACAVACARFKISQCWYVRPDSFDPNRFSIGVGDTRFFRIDASREST